MKDMAEPRILKLAILAVGGQGGGVLTSWIEDLARANGYTAQATSVAGVAQPPGPRSIASKCPPQARAPRFMP